MAATKTSSPSWPVLLRQALQQTNKPHPRIALVGIGQELRGDDAVGVIVARRLLAHAHSAFRVIDAGPAPENFTGRLRADNPDFLLLVDAVHLNAPPGTIRLLELDTVLPDSATTHTVSLRLLMDYLHATLDADVRLLGIQPSQDAVGAGLSDAVQQSVEQIVRVLAEDCA